MDGQKEDAEEKGESSSSSVNDANGPPSTPTAGLRENLVDLAVKFLSNPRVVSSPMDQKRAFLKKKGLNDNEIDRAVQLANQVPSTGQTSYPSNQVATLPPPLPVRPLNPPPPPPRRSWSEYVVLTALVGGAGYAIIQFIRYYVIPWFEKPSIQEKKMNDIHVSIEELHNSVGATVASVNESTKAIRELLSEQQQHIQLLTTQVSAIQTVSGQQTKELKEELASLKGLMLSRHQFPPTPTRQGSHGAGIPAWQRTQVQSSSPPGQKESSPTELDNHKSNEEGSPSTSSNHGNGSHSQMTGSVENLEQLQTD